MSGGEATEAPAPPAIEPGTDAPAPAPAASTAAIATDANTVATATARTPQPPQTKEAPSTSAFKEFFMTLVVPFLTGILGRVASYIMDDLDNCLKTLSTFNADQLKLLGRPVIGCALYFFHSWVRDLFNGIFCIFWCVAVAWQLYLVREGPYGWAILVAFWALVVYEFERLCLLIPRIYAMVEDVPKMPFRLVMFLLKKIAKWIEESNDSAPKF